MVVASLLMALAAGAGCGRATPEQTVYSFLGAVQAHDFAAMRGCINPEAMRKADESRGELAQEWDDLKRKYMVEPVDWRMEFELIELTCSYLEPSSALVRITGGRCRFYKLKDDRWTREGEIDFSRDDFPPLYLTERDGGWRLEAFDLFIVNALENAARTRG